MRKISVLLFTCLVASQAKAEVISLPESCFDRKLTPCLVKLNQPNQFIDADSQMIYRVEKDAIIKWTSLGKDVAFELLQGQLLVESLQGGVAVFKVNEIRFKTKKLFVKRAESRISTYDTSNFILSQYEMGAKKDQEMVLYKSDFPSKSDMVQFTSPFFKNKKNFVSFLKSIEKDWRREFNVQTERQTKVLQRSIASIESEEELKKKQQLERREELKKVRDLFFYRTFYR